MSERPNILVTRPIMDEATATLRERADVTIHENEFGIPRDELLQVIAGRDAIITMLTEQVDAESLAAAEGLLAMLGGLDPVARAITPIGRRLLDVPAHPRIARLLLGAADLGLLAEGAALAALLGSFV